MKKTKVMIVEDDTEFANEIKETLVLSGYESEICSDGETALKKVKKTNPGVILLDIKMPGISGLEVAWKLKRDRETAKIPIVAVSAFYIERETLRICGIDTHLMKPFNPLDVISKIEAVIENGR
jgi:DNA-binding response OmpR family regulator